MKRIDKHNCCGCVHSHPRPVEERGGLDCWCLGMMTGQTYFVCPSQTFSCSFFLAPGDPGSSGDPVDNKGDSIDRTFQAVEAQLATLAGWRCDSADSVINRADGLVFLASNLRTRLLLQVTVRRRTVVRRIRDPKS